MRLAIRTWMKVVYVTIPACVNAVSLPQMLLDNLPPILNQLHLIPLMICGRRNSLRYSKSKVWMSEKCVLHCEVFAAFISSLCYGQWRIDISDESVDPPFEPIEKD